MTNTPPDGRTLADIGCLHHHFERRVAGGGRRIALTDPSLPSPAETHDSATQVHGPRTYTYEELNRRANRLAHRLRRLGAGPGEFVGVCGDRSADLVVALLAVLKSGAAYVPLDPAYPAERTRFTLTDTDCRLVVGQDRHRDVFDGTGITYLPVESVTGLDEPDDDPETGVTAADPAYVIHTSGSTGTPKGVVVTHANAVRLFDACRDDFAIAREASDDVWTLFHSAAFDFSVWELWGALLHGGRLVVVPYTTSRSPESFLRLLVDERVTVLSQTPTAFRQLMRAAEAEGFPRTALRLVVFGGEALEPAALRPWIDHYGAEHPRLVNMYGITETTVHVTARDITAADCDSPHSPIGRPLRDLRVHLLDTDMRPVGGGEVGELYVGGAGVTRGYLNRPELTEQRFVPDPFGGPGERLYRTGDLAVRAADGELEFRGRIDDQVQLRGFRIELGEIDAALSGLDGVREAAVLLRRDGDGEPMLVGYAALASGATATADDLRAGLARRLPAHMVPGAVVLLDSFPLTANGKLDRRALPGPVTRTDGRTPPAPVGPSGSAERTLHAIWAEALGRDAIDPGTSFFALGGDSITAVRVAGLARDAGLPVKVEDLFRHPTLAELVRHCAASKDAHGAPGKADTPSDDGRDLLRAEDREQLPDGVADARPLTSLQLGMIFESQFSEDPTLYHDLVSVRLHGRLDTAALQRAAATLAARHEILRTSFDLGSFSEPLQLVHERVDVEVHRHDRPADGADPLDAIKAWWRTEWQRPFDFERAPLWRCHAHDLAGGRFQLSVSAHHSILDGWSFALLVTELIREYAREQAGRAEPEHSPALPYRAYVALERAAGTSAAAQDHWTRVLQGVRPLELPAADGAAGTPAMDPDVRVTLDADLVERAQMCADRLAVPAKSVFLAAHMWALHAVTGSRDITTGVVTSGRPESPGSERTLGLFLNSVPLRAELRDGTWQDLALGLFAGERALMPHRRYPLSDIQALAGAAPFDVLFNYTDFRPFDTLTDLREPRIAEWWSCDRTSFPIVVEVGRKPMDKEWELTVRRDPAKVSADFCARLAPHFLDALRRICEDPTDAH